MTSLLQLAQELFERANNPTYGISVNDEYAARLAAVIGPEDVERFASEVRRLDDPSDLTSYGWAWVLEFAVGHDITLDRELLTDLCQRWDEPALKALVIEVAVGASGDDRPPSNGEGWLGGVIDRAAPQPEKFETNSTVDNRVDRDDNAPPAVVDTSSAEALLTALLIVGTTTALAAARQLLDRDWPGAALLDAFVVARLEDSDPLSREAWTVLGR